MVDHDDGTSSSGGRDATGAHIHDLRPTAATWRPHRSPVGAALRWVIPAALVVFGVWSWVATPDDGEPLWLGVVIGGLAALVLMVRVALRLQPGARDRMVAAAARQTDHSGNEAYRAEVARRHVRRTRRWKGGSLVPARILALDDLLRGGTADRSLIYLELELDVDGVPTRVALGELVRAVHTGVLVPDGRLMVRVDDDDPTLVAVDWSASMRSPDAD